MKKIGLLSVMVVVVLMLSMAPLASAQTPVLTIWTDDQRLPVVTDMSALFTEQYGVEVVVEPAGFGDTIDALIRGAGTGEGPDIFKTAGHVTVLFGKFTEFGGRVGLEQEGVGIFHFGLGVESHRVDVVLKGGCRQGQDVGGGQVDAGFVQQAARLDDGFARHLAFEEIIAQAVVAGLDTHADGVGSGFFEQRHFFRRNQVRADVAEEG